MEDNQPEYMKNMVQIKRKVDGKHCEKMEKGDAQAKKCKLSLSDDNEAGNIDVTEQTASIQQVPPEIRLQILSYLTHMEKMSSRMVCKDWFRLCQDWSVWKSVSFEHETDCNYIEPSEVETAAHYAGHGVRRLHCVTLKEPCDYQRVIQAMPHLPKLKSICIPCCKLSWHIFELFEALKKHCQEIETFKALIIVDFDAKWLQLLKSSSVKVVHTAFHSVIPESFITALPEVFCNIQELYLSSTWFEGMSDRSLEILATSCLQLKKFLFSFSPPTTMAGVHHVASMMSLESLSIRFSAWRPWHDEPSDPEQVSEMLLAISAALDLKELHLLYNKGITDDGLIAALKNLPNLKKLVLFATGISDDGVKRMSDHLPSLEVFSRSWSAGEAPSEETLRVFLNKCSGTLKTMMLNSFIDDDILDRLRAEFPHIFIPPWWAQPLFPEEIDLLWK